ncbi:MAG: siroheme synthase CysG [Gammaproteobacteria bacterium]
MDYFPIFLKIENRECLVVGGGNVAARKVTLLARARARVTIVSPDICQKIQDLISSNNTIRHHARLFKDSDVKRCSLIIAATDDQAVNQRVSELGGAANIPVNVVDDPDLCSFIMPSIIDRSPVQVAVSTGGASPVLARLLRSRLESYVPSAYGRLATLVQSFREQVKNRFSTGKQRRQFWENILQGDVADLLFVGRDKAARDLLETTLAEAEDNPQPIGEVYLIGAGPGDPELLTFKAMRLLQMSDVIVYDRLVAPEILDYAPRDSELIYVGKQRSDHTLTQENINQLLVRLAQEGKRVARLKGGDPFIFGRGGEEISTLMESGITFQVVPGITAASGCASYSGIPLTHRDYAQSVVFVTGHLKDHSIDLNWNALAHRGQTIVFYMGLHGVRVLSRELISHGLSATTPVGLIQQGTTQNHRVLITDLENLEQTVKEKEVQPPTIIIVGEVVALHEKLHWFEPPPGGNPKPFGGRD